MILAVEKRGVRFELGHCGATAQCHQLKPSRLIHVPRVYSAHGSCLFGLEFCLVAGRSAHFRRLKCVLKLCSHDGQAFSTALAAQLAASFPGAESDLIRLFESVFAKCFCDEERVEGR
jgi:hypothetical protein